MGNLFIKNSPKGDTKTRYELDLHQLSKINHRKLTKSIYKDEHRFGGGDRKDEKLNQSCRANWKFVIKREVELRHPHQKLAEYNLHLWNKRRVKFSEEITQSLPQSCDSLRVNPGVTGKLTRLKEYLVPISIAWSRTIDTVCLNSPILTQKHLARILVEARNWKKVIFHQWRINSSGLKLPPVDFKIESLTFINWGLQNYSNWRDSPDQVYSIFSAISRSSLKTSLRKVSMDDTYLCSESKVKIAERYRLGHIRMLIF